MITRERLKKEESSVNVVFDAFSGIRVTIFVVAFVRSERNAPRLFDTECPFNLRVRSAGSEWEVEGPRALSLNDPRNGADVIDR